MRTSTSSRGGLHTRGFGCGYRYICRLVSCAWPGGGDRTCANQIVQNHYLIGTAQAERDQIDSYLSRDIIRGEVSHTPIWSLRLRMQKKTCEGILPCFLLDKASRWVCHTKKDILVTPARQNISLLGISLYATRTQSMKAQGGNQLATFYSCYPEVSLYASMAR